MKTGLVLEGGGLRGAYTAGALLWFLDNDIEFDYGVGISSGAVFLCEYLTKNKEDLKSIAVKYAGGEFQKGLKPFLREGNFVAYDHLFDHVLKEIVPIDLEKLEASAQRTEAEFGLYDMELGETTWHNVLEIKSDMRHLKAACTIPGAGKAVKINDKSYLDGGIIKMIPIERSIERGVQKHIVITTKDAGYVRKPQGKLSQWGVGLLYRKFPRIKNNVRDRHLNYNHQREVLEKLVSEGNAIEIRPSKELPVGRFGGNVEEMTNVFQLGYDDCEAHREEIMKYFE